MSESRDEMTAGPDSPRVFRTTYWRDHSNEQQGGKISLSALSPEEPQLMASRLMKAMGLQPD